MSDKANGNGVEPSTFISLCAAAKIAPKIAFIGAGNMGKAMLQGFLNSEFVPCEAICASAPSLETRNNVQKTFKIKAYANNVQMLKENSDGMIILAVKPQILPQILNEIQLFLSENAQPIGMVISIVAGVPIQKISDVILNYPKQTPVIRIMPNTPSLIGHGCSVYSKNQFCTSAHGRLVNDLMSTVGICREIDESLIDAVTGLAGSGPAYIFTVIDALSDGGVKMGLPRELSTELASQMVLGSAKMVLQTKKHPGELKNQVCSPAGTTIAGIHVLEERGIRAAFISAVAAAVGRAKEISQSDY